jgi:hypothetical protein
LTESDLNLPAANPLRPESYFLPEKQEKILLSGQNYASGVHGRDSRQAPGSLAFYPLEANFDLGLA